MKTVVIIQARMGSTRLPGKALRDLCGRPMLWHVIERLKRVELADRIVVATGESRRDDIIEEFCSSIGAECFRGSEEDVLDRYYRAAQKYGAEAVVRITSDCPLIDPRVTQKVIAAYLDNKASFDGATNAVKRTYPRGLDTEVFSFSALKRAWEDAREPRAREHVTLYMYERPEEFSFIDVVNKEDLSALRWTVDQEEDFDLVNRIYLSLYSDGRIFLFEDILKLMEERPELLEINKPVRQKDTL